jgi:hypothetical protein
MVVLLLFPPRRLEVSTLYLLEEAELSTAPQKMEKLTD